MSQDGKALSGDEAIEIDKPFKHLSLVQQSLADLKIEFYDGSGSILFNARFDPANSAVLKEDEEE
jgi:hypothetical protein